MAELQSTLSIFLKDRFTGPSRGVSAAIGRLGRDTQRFGARSAGFGATAFGTIRNLALTAGAYVGISSAFDATFGSAKTLQAALTEIGLKGELSSAQLAALDRQTRQLGAAGTTNQMQADLLAGVDAMLGAGIAGDVARDSIGIIGRTATATGASIADLSSTTAALVQNLKVTPGGLRQALEAMTQAGNDGAFEVRDMAQAFPALTASARALGMEGPGAVAELAAWLQVARRGAGDSSTAANNLSNTLQKMVTPQTTKNFKKLGVDITKTLVEAKKKGISPIQAFVETVNKVTKGGKADILGQLFGDKQVLDFLRPALADYADFLKLRERANQASGIIDRQYAERMENAVERLKSAQVALQNRLAPIGARMLEPIAGFAEGFADTLNTPDQRAGVFDRLSSGVSGFVNGLGLGDGTLSGALNQGFDLMFGKMEGAQAAGERLGRIFDRMQGWGKTVRGFADDVGYFVNSLENFAGIDTGSFGRFLGTLGGYGFSLAVASVGISMTAKAVWGLGRAIAFLTGVSTAWSIGKGLLGFGGALFGGGAPAAKTATTGGKMAEIFGGGLLARFLTAGGLRAALGRLGVAGFLAYLGYDFYESNFTPEGKKRKETFGKALNDNWQQNRDTGMGNTSGPLNVLKPFEDKFGNADKTSMSGTPTVITQPSGVQQVQVMNPMPAPTINLSITVNAATNADPRQIADDVAAEVGKRTSEALSGLQADREWSVA